ncbi:hypothetical protein LHV56_19260 [Peribacillus frigoritolerans]|uniref:AbiTii domain-containing protein n=1 Tax=Peribacillus frigoritolerans TaxID=450367 RepID=UPI002079ECD9|nr:hypothetical protein [Peribacillus frigoritolerans]USK83038.1 hypothetical protein LHV56_19260 [Peribacillus frigoritolerans]
MVLELQREAYQQQTSVSVLLRKAYTLSRKLKVEEFTKWAELEMNGYKDNMDELPDYRIVYGETKALNPYHGYIPAYFPTEYQEILRKRKMPPPLTEIELYVKQGEEKKGNLLYKYSSETQMTFKKMSKSEFEVSLHIPVSQFNTILDKVRNIILEWTLKLEEEGVLGEGMTFSAQEKEKAVKSTATIITNIGTMINSQLQQNTENSSQTLKVEGFKMENLSSLISELEKLQGEITDPALKQELASEVEVLQSQVKSPKPKMGIIKEALMSVRNIAEGTTGNVLASSIQDQVMMLLASLGGS